MSRPRYRYLGQQGLKCDASNAFHKQNMEIYLQENRRMNEQEQASAKRETGNAEREDCTAASLAIADEILMKVAPEAAGISDIRAAVLQVIERDKADVLGLLRELGEALDGNAELNTYTGEFCTLVNPDWFPRLQRALERHTGVRVLNGVVR